MWCTTLHTSNSLWRYYSFTVASVKEQLDTLLNGTYINHPFLTPKPCISVRPLVHFGKVWIVVKGWWLEGESCKSCRAVREALGAHAGVVHRVTSDVVPTFVLVKSCGFECCQGLTNWTAVPSFPCQIRLLYVYAVTPYVITPYISSAPVSREEAFV